MQPLESGSSSRLNSPLGPRLLKVSAALALGVLVGWGVQQGIQWWRAQQADDIRARPTLNLSHLSNSQITAQRPVAPSAIVRSWLVMGSQKHSLDAGQVALPSGSRFQIQLSSTMAGQLTLTAVNPAGQVVGGAIWSGVVSKGGELTTPMLRLEGTKGRESLQITLQPNDGQPAKHQVVHLWHL